MSEDSSTIPAEPRRTPLLIEFLGSMNLAITLLAALAIASIVGTVLQQNQPPQTYLIKYGPFWHEAFDRLGLYDVYGSGWFLAILAFLVVSTGICVYRHAPTMLREMRRVRVNVQAKSLAAFHHRAEGRVGLAPERYSAGVADTLGAEGWRVRVVEGEGHWLVAADRGAFNRMGYLLTHVAIVVICVGGLIDGKLHLKFAMLAGSLVPETRDIVASEVPQQSRLGTGNPAFRGAVQIPEGGRGNVAFLQLRDGYVVQELPFEIEVEDFRVEHHSNGQPKSFESDLVIHDPDLPEPIAKTIAVNHPLIHKGIAIFQSSFGDGGSALELDVRPLGARADETVRVETLVFGRYPLQMGESTHTLEILDFRPFNVEQVQDETGKPKGTNVGPSFTWRLRDATGAGREYITYMLPLELEGRSVLVSGTREAPSQPWSYLYIPTDAQGGPGRFMKLLAWISDPERVATAVSAAAGDLTGDDAGADGPAREQVMNSMQRLILTFARGGYEAVVGEVGRDLPREKAEEVLPVFVRVLHAGIQTLYVQLLAEEGLDEVGLAEQRFLEDAVHAVAAIPFYGSPFWLELKGFEQVQSTGLQIARAPGQKVVYAGSLILIIGIFLLFYVAHRRIWVWIEPEGKGSRVLVAGQTNRDILEFGEQFESLAARILNANHRMGTESNAAT